ncbi:GMC family oxidoreductase [Neptunicella sp. SCSIO 80796]|uniref:GMC family oxidoreductase n=1 Tax=Neptunicella plasticusilytica TaxID=3117012 RepID=UPI003A4DBB7E
MQQTGPLSFDYIIIGGGSAGATLAARLSADKHNLVCLLEAGSKDTNPFIHIPFGLAALAHIKGLNWNYSTSPQAQLNQRCLYWPRGKTLGGSSSVNAMCYIRGSQNDYEQWKQMGASGWGWQDVLPYFKKSESYAQGDPRWHGDSGPLSVTELRYTSPLSTSFVHSAREMGLDLVADFNQLDREGLGFYQVTQTKGQRCSAAKAYLAPIQDRTNLTIMTQVLVEKILIEQQVATGVQLKSGQQAIQLNARKEVIVCAGAINSPQLLMLSGIGPKRQLQNLGIKSVFDLPGVGQNLQDHLDAIIQHECKNSQGYGLALNAIPVWLKSAYHYWRKRQGMLTSNIAEAGGFIKSSYASAEPDIQLHFLPAKLQDHGRKYVYGYGYSLHACALYPKSRGYIALASADPAQPAIIDPCYLTHPDDQKIMIEAVKLARRLLSCAEFSQYQSIELQPGTEIQSDQQILQFVREQAQTIYHPVGTCKIGAIDDPMAVVDPQLRVKGIKALRVVDASVMPTIIGGNTNAAVIMIAEKAADMILQLNSVNSGQVETEL